MIRNRKLIEVALPLEAINLASAREKSIRHGHPSTLHLWWARRPLAAARAVIFAQMVDDPSGYVEVLRADTKLRRKAEVALKARVNLWQQARSLVSTAPATDSSIPDPGPLPTLEDVLADHERQRLFRIIENLVLWESTTNEAVLQSARDEIWSSWRRTCAENAGEPGADKLFDRHRLPAFHDPFAGGGALPLEAQLLGLESNASDLNPVAVLITKSMIEIPPKFSDRPPINPTWQKKLDDEKSMTQWRGAMGLAEDVRYYGKWIRDEAEKRIGHFYPKVVITAEIVAGRPDLKEYLGRELTVIAWLWARTVKSPNPAVTQTAVPLVSTFMLSAKPGKEAYVEPLISDGNYIFTVKVGLPKNAEAAKHGTKTGSNGSFTCLMSGTPMPFEYLRAEAKAGRMGSQLMALVAEGDRGRVFLPPTSDMEALALSATPNDAPETDMPTKALGFRVQEYGMTKWRDMFTSRQLLALTMFSDLVSEAQKVIEQDAIVAGVFKDSKNLRDGGTGATAYAQALAVYLAFAVDKVAEGSTTICTWSSLPSKLHVVSTFGRQAIPMTWDYAEANVFADSSGNILRMCELAAAVIDRQCSRSEISRGSSFQADAQSLTFPFARVVSTDPPYYDNIGYGDLSDFFYLWLRRSLRSVFPDLFATVAVPKAEELIASPFRRGSRDEAETFFLEGMTEAMHRIAQQAHPGFPVTIYYAFKQSESDGGGGTASTGWDTFLAAVIRAGFAISGTWPVRTERSGGFRNKGQNALASSIVLVCRKRELEAPNATRREFVLALKAELPAALAHLQRGNIAPVDLAQAAIGPGMAVYTRYFKVLDTEGNPLSVRDALALINQTLDEALAEQEGDFDADSRWALTWFEQVGFAEGEYGVAEQLSKSKNTSVAGMVDAGILESKRGKVRLLRPEELPTDWDPSTDGRLTSWEVVHQLIRVASTGGEEAAAMLYSKLGVKAEPARELCYRLYALCERKKRAPEALAYNGLVQSWPEITRLAGEASAVSPAPGTNDMFAKE